MFDIVTIGAGTRDVFLVSKEFKFIESSAFSTGIGECVALGTKIELDEIVHTTGGGATNAAATFARLGYKSAVVCRVGDDGAGRDTIIDLQREGINTTLVRRIPGGMTGYSTLLTASSGERTVLVYRGVSGAFTSADIPWKECAAKWLYVTSLAGNTDLLKRIVTHTKKYGAHVAWNPGSLELKKGMASLRPILKQISILNFNREEAENISGKKKLPDMFKALAHPGMTVIITDGPNGAYAHRDGKTWFAGTRGIKSKSHTGAGDAFGSGFLAAYIKSGDVPTSLATGTLNAESVIQHVGAKAGILRKWPTAAQIKSIPIKTL